MAGIKKDTHLIGCWPLKTDTKDHSFAGHETKAVDVELGATGPSGKPGTAARFNGRTSLLEIADHPSLHLGTSDMTVSAWIRTDSENRDVAGQIIDKFAPDERKGFQLYILTNNGVTSTAQPNFRHLQFGIDDGRNDSGWTDCGRPGNAVFISSLLVSDGILYAGTLETGANEMGHLWRYDGGSKWFDLGNPLGCNIIQSLCEFEGSIYAGTGRYVGQGSALGVMPNQVPGGKVFRLKPEGGWEDCGHPGLEDAIPESVVVADNIFSTGKADDVIALTSYRRELYGISNHRTGVFKYEGKKNWRNIGLNHCRNFGLTIYRGSMYALQNGEGEIYRYEGGTEWAFCGRLEGSSQNYGAVIFQGDLYVGTWPNGEVFRYDGGENWVKKFGRIGSEKEIMAMTLYNGKVFLGTLPLGQVWRMDRDGWPFIDTLDHSIDVVYRRVWSMAVYKGKLFAGTLPSGHAYCYECGKMATADKCLPDGWHHIAAVKKSHVLMLYLDGKPIAQSSAFHPGDYDLSNNLPMRIGFGTYEHFNGLMSDIRLYSRSLSEEEINQISQIRD